MEFHNRSSLSSRVSTTTSSAETETANPPSMWRPELDKDVLCRRCSTTWRLTRRCGKQHKTDHGVSDGPSSQLWWWFWIYQTPRWSKWTEIFQQWKNSPNSVVLSGMTVEEAASSWIASTRPGTPSLLPYCTAQNTEGWLKATFNKLSAFHTKNLRRILLIFWPETIYN